MRQFFRSIALFTPFAAAVYVLLVVLIGNFAAGLPGKNLKYRKGGIGFLYSRLHEIDTVKNVDILFLGSSHTYRGFDTRIFRRYGMRTLNLGSSAQSVLQTEVLLRRYLDRIRPAMIVWEISPASLISDGVESSLDIVSNDTNDLWSFAMAARQNHITVYNTLVYSVYLDVFRQNAAFTEGRRKVDDMYIDGGFVQKDPQTYRIINRAPAEVSINPKQFTSFERCLSLIRESGSRLVMVQAPIARSLYDSYLRHEDFDVQIGAYGPYYNFNEILALHDSTDFYDSDHMNQAGVEQFNTALIRRLSDRR
jgi:hypothetical protein